jgi:DNA-binding SARP family transcriptional activator
LWAERAPPSAPKIVQGYVSQLRRAFGAEDQGRLRTRPPGYVLEVERTSSTSTASSYS